MKKKLIILGLSLSLAATVALSACGTNKGETALKSANDVYGMGAVSTVKLLGSKLPSAAVKSFSALNSSVASTASERLGSVETVEEVKLQAEKFNEYFSALDSFLGDEIVSTTTEENTDSQYPYELKMVISGKDFNGEAVNYTMYYTETLLGERSELELDEIDDDDDEIDDDDTDDKTDGEESEKEFRLDGVMVIDGVAYQLEGERKEEQEADESESELKIRAYADIADKKTYIQMEQEHSIENGESETEYVYSIYSDGVLIEQTAVEFETENEDGKEETEYELEFRSGTGRGRYSVEREVKNNTTEIKVKYNIDGKTGEFRISEIVENGEKKYEYTFADGSKLLLDRL